MGAPAQLHHAPVGLVTVHGHLHTAAAGGDGVVAAFGVQLLENCLQLGNVLQGGSGGHVPAVQENMAVGLLHTGSMGSLQKGNQVADVGVDVAVGQQAQKVHGLAGLGIFHQVNPGVGGKQGAVFDGLANQLRTLGVNLAAAQGIVTYLGVAHILIGGQTHGGAMGFQVGVGAGGKQAVQGGGVGLGNSIAAAAVSLAYAVHNYKYNGFFHRYSLRKTY